ncbi:hypothetical protein B0O80DRAFT_530682, partial [Mortierella sp. GBAus27b]
MTMHLHGGKEGGLRTPTYTIHVGGSLCQSLYRLIPLVQSQRCAFSAVRWIGQCACWASRTVCLLGTEFSLCNLIMERDRLSAEKTGVGSNPLVSKTCHVSGSQRWIESQGNSGHSYWWRRKRTGSKNVQGNACQESWQVSNMEVIGSCDDVTYPFKITPWETTRVFTSRPIFPVDICMKLVVILNSG